MLPSARSLGGEDSQPPRMAALPRRSQTLPTRMNVDSLPRSEHYLVLDRRQGVGTSDESMAGSEPPLILVVSGDEAVRQHLVQRRPISCFTHIGCNHRPSGSC
jgi:hypothetical protein